MVISLKKPWLSCGRPPSVIEPSAKRSTKLDLHERKTYGYRERDEAQRQSFLETIAADYTDDDRVYVDEAGVNDTLDYEYGWCDASERFYDLKLGHRTQRISMIAG